MESNEKSAEHVSAVPLERSVRPVAWADDEAFAGGIGNVASTAAKEYWERGHWVDRKSAERLKHPLYSLRPEQLRLLWEAEKDKAWRARDFTLCKCDHCESCDHCFPPEFREGGIYGPNV